MYEMIAPQGKRTDQSNDSYSVVGNNYKKDDCK